MMDLKALKVGLDQLEEEKRVPREKILSAIEDALVAAYKKDNGKTGQIIRANADEDSGATEFALVTHSMGGLIARDLLTAPDLAYLALSRSGQAPRCQRLIMVAPPNHGSQLAHLRLASEIREHAYKVWTGQGTLLGPFLDGQGQAGKDLLPGSPFLKLLNQRRLPPELPVTIIAGLLNDDAPQLGDGAVSLEATKLAEVSDFHVFTASHLFLIRNISPESNRVPPAVPLIRTLLQPLRPTIP